MASLNSTEHPSQWYPATDVHQVVEPLTSIYSLTNVKKAKLIFGVQFDLLKKLGVISFRYLYKL